VVGLKSPSSTRESKCLEDAASAFAPKQLHLNRILKLCWYPLSHSVQFMLRRTPIRGLDSWLSRRVSAREDVMSSLSSTLSHKCVLTLLLLLHKIAQHTRNRRIGILPLKRLDLNLLPISNPPDHLIRTSRQRTAAKTMSPE
jgi:hypothetical protein